MDFHDTTLFGDHRLLSRPGTAASEHVLFMAAARLGLPMFNGMPKRVVPPISFLDRVWAGCRARKAGRFEDALHSFEVAATIAPNDECAAYALQGAGQVGSLLGDLETVNRAFGKALSIGRASRVSIALDYAHHLCDFGLVDEGLEYLDEVEDELKHSRKPVLLTEHRLQVGFVKAAYMIDYELEVGRRLSNVHRISVRLVGSDLLSGSYDTNAAGVLLTKGLIYVRYPSIGPVDMESRIVEIGDLWSEAQVDPVTKAKIGLVHAMGLLATGNPAGSLMCAGQVRRDLKVYFRNVRCSTVTTSGAIDHLLTTLQAAARHASKNPRAVAEVLSLLRTSGARGCCGSILLKIYTDMLAAYGRSTDVSVIKRWGSMDDRAGSLQPFVKEALWEQL
jgi:hypothetical protein